MRGRSSKEASGRMIGSYRAWETGAMMKRQSGVVQRAPVTLLAVSAVVVHPDPAATARISSVAAPDLPRSGSQHSPARICKDISLPRRFFRILCRTGE